RLHVPIAMHQASPAPFVDMRLGDGESLVLGDLRINVMHTPGHTRDSMCLRIGCRLFTGDTLLIGATGRTDLPTGDPEALHDSLFNHLLRLDPALEVYPAHEYKNRDHTTLAQEIEQNPRLQKRDRADFVQMMRNLNLSMPTHLTEALRTNLSGGKTITQLLAEAAAVVPFMSLDELKAAWMRRMPGSWCSMCVNGMPTVPGISRARACCRAASSSCGSMRNCRIPHSGF